MNPNISFTNNVIYMITIKQDIVAGLVAADNKFLFGIKDPKGSGVYADCWHIPGRGVEQGETNFEALAREMWEEMSIKITDAGVTLLDNKGIGEAQKVLNEMAK